MAERARGGYGLEWAVVPLVALAGCVDRIGWLSLNQLFVTS